MAKSTISRIWLVGLVLLIVGVVAAVAGAVAGVPRFDASHVENPQYLLDEMHTSAGGVLVIVAFIALAIGGLVQLIAWMLGMAATAMIGRWAWFLGLLVLGLIGLEFLVMLAYVIWGPAERQVPEALTPA